MAPIEIASSPPRCPGERDYSEETRREISITLDMTPPGEWAELALCPGLFGCPYSTTEAALADGVEENFCPGCRVIHLYRLA